MIFSIKNIDNTTIISIRAERFDLSEYLSLSKTIIKQARVKRRHIILNLNHSVAVTIYHGNAFFLWRFCDSK